MEWYYVWWPWLTYRRVAQVCQHQLSFLFVFAVCTNFMGLLQVPRTCLVLPVYIDIALLLFNLYLSKNKILAMKMNIRYMSQNPQSLLGGRYRHTVPILPYTPNSGPRSSYRVNEARISSSRHGLAQFVRGTAVQNRRPLVTALLILGVVDAGRTVVRRRADESTTTSMTVTNQTSVDGDITVMAADLAGAWAYTGAERSALSSDSGVNRGVWGSWPPKNMFEESEHILTLTPKMSHSFILNCCWITLQVLHHEGWKTCVRSGR